MTGLTFTLTPIGGPSVAQGWRALDRVMLVAAVLWMAEATVRLPLGSALTAMIYAYFSLRMAMWLLRGGPDLSVLLAILPFPAICLTSALWSLAPQTSAVAGVQLLFTIMIAVWAAYHVSLKEIAGLVAAGLGLALALSTVNLLGLWPPLYSWEGGFLGVFTNKNALGQRAALALLTAVSISLWSRGTARWAGIGLAVLAMALLMLSLSVTGILLGTGAACVALWLHIGARRRAVGAMLTMIVAMAIAMLLLWGHVAGRDLVSEALGLFGKSHSLTGRTLLWEIALDRIAGASIWGDGYMAFWVAESTRHDTAVIATLYGATVQSFHNFALEILVATGVPGLVAFAVTLVACTRWILRAPAGPHKRWAVLALGLLLAFSLLGSSLYRPHEISLFLVVALGVSARSGAAYSWRIRPRAMSI